MKPRGSNLWRFTPRLALGLAVLLLLAGVAVSVLNERARIQQKLRDTRVQAEVVATAVTAALAFEEARAVQEYLSALQANPAIGVAAIYRVDGSLFASYARGPDGEVPRRAPPPGAGVVDNRLVVARPVVEGEAVLGSVYLWAALDPLATRLTRHAGFALLIVMAALLLTVLGAANGALGRLYRELEVRAAELADANHHLQQQIRDRERAEEALRQAQKMEVIGQLTGGVAHDFNNLLTIIAGNLETVQRQLRAGTPDLARVRQAIDDAAEGAQRAATLTRSLLAFSRRQPLAPSALDVNKLLSRMSLLLHRALGEQVEIETVLGGGMWLTHADSNQLESAILNLAVNARDAMPDGGKLTLETANAYLDEAYAAAQEEVPPGQYVVLCVTDTGTGMSEEAKARAFDPFFTTKDIGHGTGLGLSQVYGFVKQSGGNVRIYSELGQGTTVKIYLPRLLAPVERADEDEARAPAPAEGGGRLILVVEDDEAVRRHSENILTELGYCVLSAATGEAGLALLERRDDVELLFTDVGLPGGMNGRELAEQAQRLRPQLRVLYTTGYAKNAIVHNGRLDAGVELITKPFTFDALAARVQDVLSRGGGERPAPRCLLVVEDEFLIARMIESILEDMGFEVALASSAAEGEEKARALGDRLAGAIVDIGLPDRRGNELAAELRGTHEQLPIVLASGYSEGAARGEFGDERTAFLSKPFDAADLGAVLSRLGLRPGSAAGGAG